MAAMFGFEDIGEGFIKMKNRMNLFLILILSAVIYIIPRPLSYADYGSFTVNVPNAQGGYTAIVIKQSGDGYVGPQGEYYSSFPSVTQLQNVYGLTNPVAVESYTVNVPNVQGGYTAIVIKQSGDGYVDPQGEYYPQFPSVSQLQNVYGATSPYQQTVANNYDEANIGQTGDYVTVTVAPPALPVYEQPNPPAPDYIWTPGYWAFDNFFQDYYWVPGTWVEPPSEGLLWTPGYWNWRNGLYVYSDGYWGHHVGFYGGINYGHGYEGSGFSGGGWNNGVFINKTVNITNITNNTSSFNGGPGGTNAKPTYEEQIVMKEKHIPPTAVQTLHLQAAIHDPTLRASLNHGKPTIAATVKPGVFKGNGVVAAKQGVAVVRYPAVTQQSKTLTYVPKTSNETQVQQKTLPAQKYIQQGTNQPKGLTKEQLSQKKNAALKAQQEKKKKELLQKQQEQQGQSSNPQYKAGNGS
jgi:hypothetical protein